MPAKGTKLKYAGKHNFINIKLWKKYKKETQNPATYAEFRKIIAASLEETKNWVLKEPIGFRLPFRLGNIAINKFKTYGEFVSYKKTRSIEGKPIKNFNLHTGGYVFRIQWFYNTRSARERTSFWWFVAERKFKRSLAKVLKSDKPPLFNTYMQSQFSTIKL